LALLASSEAIVVQLDLASPNNGAPDGIMDVLIGVPNEFENNVRPPNDCASLNEACFGVYRPSTRSQRTGEAAAYSASDPVIAKVYSGLK
jgi:hypothetical protein